MNTGRGQQRADPGRSAVRRIVHVDVYAARAVGRGVVHHGRVDDTVRVDVRVEIGVVVGGPVRGWQQDGSGPVAVGSVLVGKRCADVWFAAVPVEVHIRDVDPP